MTGATGVMKAWQLKLCHSYCVSKSHGVWSCVSNVFSQYVKGTMIRLMEAVERERNEFTSKIHLKVNKDNIYM